MADLDLGSTELTVVENTIFGNKRVVFATFTPSTVADTVDVGMSRVEVAVGSHASTAASAVALSFEATTAGVVVRTNAGTPVSFQAIGR